MPTGDPPPSPAATTGPLRRRRRGPSSLRLRPRGRLAEPGATQPGDDVHASRLWTGEEFLFLDANAADAGLRPGGRHLAGHRGLGPQRRPPRLDRRRRHRLARPHRHPRPASRSTTRLHLARAPGGDEGLGRTTRSRHAQVSDPLSHIRRPSGISAHGDVGDVVLEVLGAGDHEAEGLVPTGEVGLGVGHGPGRGGRPGRPRRSCRARPAPRASGRVTTRPSRVAPSGSVRGGVGRRRPGVVLEPAVLGVRLGSRPSNSG